MKKLTAKKEDSSIPLAAASVTAGPEDFPTRRALEEFNEKTRKHYVTKHGGGTDSDSSIPSSLGPMDHED